MTNHFTNASSNDIHQRTDICKMQYCNVCNNNVCFNKSPFCGKACMLSGNTSCLLD